MKVLFLLPYPVDTVPGQRLKFEQYFDYFRGNNIEIKVCSFISPRFYKILYKKGRYLTKILYTLKGYLLRLRHIFDAREFDVVYLFLWLAPFGPAALEFLLKKMNRPVIYDIDDLVYLPHSSEANKFTRFLKNKNRITVNMKMAEHIIVCTEHLRRYALQYNKNVTNISSTIDTRRYFVHNPYSNERKVVVGWSGSHTTSQYLHLLDDVLGKLQKKYGIGIKVIGDKDFQIPDVETEAQNWKLDTEVEDLQKIDIGLYPLPDEEWVLGKSGLKALQYMAVGIPVVCTAIGEAARFIQDNVNGFLAENKEDWLNKISLLIENPELRRRLGAAARKTVEERFSLEANAPRYLGILQEAYKGRYGRGQG